MHRGASLSLPLGGEHEGQALLPMPRLPMPNEAALRVLGTAATAALSAGEPVCMLRQRSGAGDVHREVDPSGTALGQPQLRTPKPRAEHSGQNTGPERKAIGNDQGKLRSLANDILACLKTDLLLPPEAWPGNKIS